MPGGDLVSLDFAALDGADGNAAALLSPTMRPLAWDESGQQQPNAANRADQF